MLKYLILAAGPAGLAFAHSKHVLGLGRWGEWEHYNSDLTVLKGMELADKFCT